MSAYSPISPCCVIFLWLPFFQGTQRTRWFSPPPTQPLEARGSPPYFCALRDCLALMQLCFSSCQAAADQIFFYTLKIHRQQSVSMYSRLEARSKRKKKKSKWLWTSRETRSTILSCAKCQASCWEQWWEKPSSWPSEGRATNELSFIHVLREHRGHTLLWDRRWVRPLRRDGPGAGKVY